jgi:hypothetical protein
MHSIANDDARSYGPAVLPLPHGFSGCVDYATSCIYPSTALMFSFYPAAYVPIPSTLFSSVIRRSVDRGRRRRSDAKQFARDGYVEGLAGRHAFGWRSLVYTAS